MDEKTLLATAIGLALGVTALTAHAASLSIGQPLTIAPISPSTGPTAPNFLTGSWFAVNAFGGADITSDEITPIYPGGPAGIGIVIDTLQLNGPTTAFTSTIGTVSQQLSGPGQIDTWNFFGFQGDDYTNVSGGGTPITGGTTNGLNLSGWTMYWNGVADIRMGGGAWTPGNATAFGVPAGYTFSSGVAQFSWDGVYGDSYMLNYAATVSGATGAAQGLNGVQYFLHLTGVVPGLPLPAAAWLFGSGLLGLAGVASRKKKPG